MKEHVSHTHQSFLQNSGLAQNVAFIQSAGKDFASELSTLLLSGIAIACFWSTALVEIFGLFTVLLSLAYLFLSPMLPPAQRNKLNGQSHAMHVALSLWGVYILCVIGSYLSSGTSFTRHPGLLWHPLLFPALLVLPVDMRELKIWGNLFLLSGACASVVSLARNSMSEFSQQLPNFIGLTTYANLLTLATLVAMALLVSCKEKKLEFYRTAACGFIVLLGVFCTSERFPVVMAVLLGSLVSLSSRFQTLVAWFVSCTVCSVLSPTKLIAKFQFLMHSSHIDRYVVWREGVRLLSSAPLFGFGPDCYERVLPVSAWREFVNKPPDSWHNDFLQTGLDSGLAGAAALTALIATVMVSSPFINRHFTNDVRRHEHDVIMLLTLCLTGFAFVGGVLSTAILGNVFWILLGLTSRISSYEMVGQEDIGRI